ncbi:TraB/GumN family protein [Croceibacterium soli]|nr:TraB/GumN family protein [Croceibacterium soli]
MRWLLALAGALALAGCGEPDRDWPEPSPALWEVTGLGGERGWLFGTIHSLPEGAEWRTATVDDAFARSSLLVVEVAELGQADKAAAVFRRLSTTPGLPPLTQRVPPDDRPALAAFLDRAEMDEDAFSDTESWGAALLLANAVRRSDSGNGVDRALIAEAQRVEGLESLEDQYGMFDRLPALEQAELLTGLAADAEGDFEDRRVIAWLTGDMVALERDSTAGILADPELREALQLARNRAWALRVAALLKRGERPFVAVGAAHMWGDEGLPALLAAKGFKVRRVQ